MDYHMPRVMQWAQNRTLAHFPVMHPYQNLRPYWAEAVILHLRVLWGNDQPAGLVQWFIMIASLIATSGIAALLGGERKAQWLTAVLTFSIPMGLLQATTTQNDYVSAFWVVCLAYFVILSRKRDLSHLELLGLGLSLGLGMLTKGTFFPFAGPLMLWYFIGQLIDRNWKRGLMEGIVLVFLVLATNGLFWGRNIHSTGGPYGAWNPLRILLGLFPGHSIVPDARLSAGISESVSVNQEWEEPSYDQLVVETSGLAYQSIAVQYRDQAANPRLVQLARLVAMNFVSPFSAFNKAYFKFLRSWPEFFPEQWVRKLEDAAWNHEDTAGSPVHLILILLAMVIAMYKAISGRFRYGLIYSLILAVSFVLISLVSARGDIFGIRYQLGCFLLGVPLVGVLFSGRDRLWLVMTIFMLFYSIPYILLSNMRPVIGHQPWPTRVGSVFTASKDDLLFAINPGDEQKLVLISEQIQAAECKEVGLSYSRNNLEYQLWYLLDAPQNGITIRHLVSLPEFDSGQYESFSPCAVVCTACEALPGEYALPISEDYGGVRLFLQMDIR
jgi:4-amino-4-deoxy-L-arabinose transferase-like glycosyltransferase